MYDRNQLVHAVVWPNGKKATYSLVDTHGVSQSEIQVREPFKGSELAKMVPQGFLIMFEDCDVLSMSGKLVIAADVEFDTAVVTERAEITFEERMARLERRERRREKREHELALRNRALQERLEAAEAVTEDPETPQAPLVVETPPATPQEPQEGQNNEA